MGTVNSEPRTFSGGFEKVNSELFVGVIFLVVVILMSGAAFSYVELERTRREASLRKDNLNGSKSAMTERQTSTDD